VDRFLGAFGRHARIYIVLMLAIGLVLIGAGLAVGPGDQSALGRTTTGPGGATVMPIPTNSSGAPIFRPDFIHPGLKATDDAYIHRGLVFNSLTANPASERGEVDLVWGASPGKLEPGIFNIAYNPFSRIGNGADFQPLYSLEWFKANHPTWIEY
jgi:hypothetical protein